MKDEDVAKALGWKKKSIGPYASYEKTTENLWMSTHGDYPPPFTTSLDAVTQEIERRGLRYTLDRKYIDKCEAIVSEFGGVSRWKPADTAPLALCKALMAYLEEKNEA